MRFYLFDNMTADESAELTSVLQTFQGERTEALYATHYGLERSVLGLMLCFLVFYASNRYLRKFLTTDIDLPSVHLKPAWLFLGLPIGLALNQYRLANLAPYLFTMAGVLLIGSLVKSRLSEKALSRSFASLNFFRLVWLGALMSDLSGHTLFTLEAPQRPFQTPVLIAILVLSYLPLSQKSCLFKYATELKEQCQFGFHLGWIESSGLLLTLYYLCFVEKQPFQATLAVFTTFLIGRVVHSSLIWTALHLKAEKPEMSRAAAPMRVATGCWFLAPIPFVEVFWNNGPVLVLFWLGGLLGLALHGRPWGSIVAQSKTMRYEMPSQSRQAASFTSGLTLCQKAAILFMSLPPEESAQLFSELGPDEVQTVTLAITQLPSISPNIRARILEEFLSIDPIRKVAK